MAKITVTANCERCGRIVPVESLNFEAITHHRVRVVECLDRKACNRAKRKAKR